MSSENSDHVQRDDNPLQYWRYWENLPFKYPILLQFIYYIGNPLIIKKVLPLQLNNVTVCLESRCNDIGKVIKNFLT